MSLATVDGEIRIYSGRSRSGKTAKCLIDIEAGKFETVFVFDIEAQWCEIKGFKKITSLAEFKKICVSGKKGKYAVVVSGDLKPEFEKFCKCVFHYASFFGRCAIVAEELASVTTTSKAPPAWGDVCRRILKRGAWVFAISQRWAEADKTAIGNASRIFIFQPATMSDAKYLAEKVNLNESDIFNLDYDTYQYIEYDNGNRSNEFKNLPFPNKKAKKAN
jgi:hypothetical protein